MTRSDASDGSFDCSDAFLVIKRPLHQKHGNPKVPDGTGRRRRSDQPTSIDRFLPARSRHHPTRLLTCKLFSLATPSSRFAANSAGGSVPLAALHTSAA